MGRFEKSVVVDSGVDRRELGYYSTPEFIADFMTSTMLKINPAGKYALDPCVGKEELIKGLFKHNIIVDGIDIYDHQDHYYCNYIKDDFIDFYRREKVNLFFNQNINLKYDYYIANPPYNCHEVDYIRNNKKTLSMLFGNIGVLNMYSMFISALIDIAKDGAVISIISSDSFLTARMHNYLREQIIKNCSIHYLLLCPTDLFWDQKADVRTCIMILQKGKSYQDKVLTMNRPKNKSDLKEKLESRSFIEVELNSIINSSADNEYEFVIDVPAEIQNLFKHPRLGQLFKCITGISTGADSKYISKERRTGFEIPFFKNPGSRKFYCEADGYLTNDYLQQDKEVKNFMVRNKGYLLREGITCSSMGLPFSACYLPENSTYGVNANIFCNKNDIWWLLSYLNSSLVTYLVRGVLIRSNMITSGYVSKIPIISLSEKVKSSLGSIAQSAYVNKITQKDYQPVIDKIDNIIFAELKLPTEVEYQIKDFGKNLQFSV